MACICSYAICAGRPLVLCPECQEAADRRRQAEEAIATQRRVAQLEARVAELEAAAGLPPADG